MNNPEDDDFGYTPATDPQIQKEWEDAKLLYETLKDIDEKEGLHIEVLMEVLRSVIGATERKEVLDIPQYITNGMVEWDL